MCVYLYIFIANSDSICACAASTLMSSFRGKKKSSFTGLVPQSSLVVSIQLAKLLTTSAQIVLLLQGVNKWLEEVKQSYTHSKVGDEWWWMSDGFNCGVQNYIDVCRFKFYYDDGGGQEVESALLHSWLSHWCAQALVFCWHWEEFNLQKKYILQIQS